jgi:hypothetical protein
VVRRSLGPPRAITFNFAPPFPAPLFLGILTITENPGVPDIVGVIVVGNPAQGGTCDLQMSHTLFDPIWNFVAPPAKGLAIVLTYDDTHFSVTHVDVSSTQPFAISSAGLDNLDTIANTLQQALQLATTLGGRSDPPPTGPSLNGDGLMPPQ